MMATARIARIVAILSMEGFWNRLALFGVTVEETKCVHCGRCASVCPMDAEMAGDAQCISCGKCVNACPTAAISFRKLGVGEKDQETEGNGGE